MSDSFKCLFSQDYLHFHKIKDLIKRSESIYLTFSWDKDSKLFPERSSEIQINFRWKSKILLRILIQLGFFFVCEMTFG